MRVLVTGGSGFIGTNLIEALIAKGIECNSLDISMPKIEHHRRVWTECDILNKVALFTKFKEINPTHVIHLAARTDIDGKNIEDYRVNYEGTLNVLLAGNEVPALRRMIVTSTQFVHQYKGTPKDENDYAPYTVYGESKVIVEQYTKQTNLNYSWTIIRPTNIWGPWHPRYPFEFWKTLGRGLYFHPGKQEVLRSYGYVGNVIWQMMRIMDLPDAIVNHKVFYVGDIPVNLYEWVNHFSIFMRRENVIVIPRWIVRCIALFGDIVGKIGIEFPLSTSRYKSMTSGNAAPMQPTFDVLGIPPYTLMEGTKQTVEWLKTYHPTLVKR